MRYFRVMNPLLISLINKLTFVEFSTNIMLKVRNFDTNYFLSKTNFSQPNVNNFLKSN